METLFARPRSSEIAGRVIAEKYVLDRALAAGGMGSVWAAWNTQLDVPVAVKFMAAGLAGSAELVARFEREARAAAQIRSPHVVQIFEHGVEDGQPFIVMELLEGEDLGQRLRREGRLSLAETARVVHDVCRALRRAHALGIVHRDLKPANIFLAQGEEDDELTVKVLDFGVVKSISESVESGVTKTGELIGTPHYMSPEQARSVKSVDHRSDLWSLAVIAYRALAASLPFPDEQGIEMLLRVCSEHAPPPSRFARELGPEVDAFFERALAIDPDRRFQTAREMAQAMDRLAGMPASSRRGPLSSLADITPPSSRVFPAHAYVYTSASSAPPPCAPHTRAPSSRRSMTLQSAGARDPTPPASTHGLADAPTRVSAAIVRGTARTPGSERSVPVSIVAPGGAESVAPTTASASATERSGAPAMAALPARLIVARPQLPLAAAGAFVLFALSIVLSPLDRAPPEARHDPAGSNRITWTSALGADLPASPMLATPEIARVADLAEEPQGIPSAPSIGAPSPVAAPASAQAIRSPLTSATALPTASLSARSISATPPRPAPTWAKKPSAPAKKPSAPRPTGAPIRGAR